MGWLLPYWYWYLQNGVVAAVAAVHTSRKKKVIAKFCLFWIVFNSLVMWNSSARAWDSKEIFLTLLLQVHTWSQYLRSAALKWSNFWSKYCSKEGDGFNRGFLILMFGDWMTWSRRKTHWARDTILKPNKNRVIKIILNYFSKKIKQKYKFLWHCKHAVLKNIEFSWLIPFFQQAINKFLKNWCT